MAKAKRKLSAYNRFIARELKGKSGAGHKGRFKAAVAKWKRSNKSGTRKKSRSISKRSSTVSRARPRARAKPKSTGGRKMAGFNSQKIMKYIRLAALAAPIITQVVRQDSMENKAHHVLKAYTGVNNKTGQFDGAALMAGWTPYLASVVATYGIPKLAGIIRSL